MLRPPSKKPRSLTMGPKFSVREGTPQLLEALPTEPTRAAPKRPEKSPASKRFVFSMMFVIICSAVRTMLVVTL